MRIGQLAKQTNLSRDTIRFYERNGLIHSNPSDNPANTYRNYDSETVFTLEMVREAQAAGFTIAELKKFMQQLQSAPPDDFDGEDFLQNKISDAQNDF